MRRRAVQDALLPDIHIVDLGRTEARLPKREQSRLETYNLGDRLRVVALLLVPVVVALGRRAAVRKRA